MIGVILAAGMAKRLRPLTDICPKCLLEVGGRTLLERIGGVRIDVSYMGFLVEPELPLGGSSCGSCGSSCGSH